MGETVIPLQDGETVSDDDWGTAQCQTINWLVDSSGSLRPRPGIVNTQFDPGVYNLTTGSPPIGMYVWLNVFNQRETLVYVLADRSIWAKDLISNITTAISDGTAATMLSGSASQAIFAEDTQRLIIAGGGELQVWTGTGLTSRIAAVVPGTNEPPQSASHVLNINNYLVANAGALPSTNGRIFWSSLGDTNHTTWPPLNFNTADADPDAIVALGANLRQVFAFGSKTLQVFGISADPTLPFSASSAIALGCGAPYSVIRIDNGFAMLDDADRFVATDGTSYNVLNDDIVKLVRELGTVSDCFGFRYLAGYWDLLCWVFPAAKRGYAYDQKRKGWYQLRGWNGVDDWAGIRIGCFTPWTTGRLRLVGDSLYTNIWTLDPSTLIDQGPSLPLVVERVTDRVDGGSTERKRCTRVRFYVKRGQATSSPGYLDVAKRDDDGPWSAMQTLSLGIAGDYTSYVDWFPGGVYRRRQYRVRYSSGVAMSISKAVEYWEPLGG